MEPQSPAAGQRRFPSVTKADRVVVQIGVVLGVLASAVILAAGCPPSPKQRTPVPERVIRLQKENEVNFEGACLAFSPTDSHLAVGTKGISSGKVGESWQGYLKVFDWSQSKELACIVFDRHVNSIAYSKDGKRLAVGTGAQMDRPIPWGHDAYQNKPGELAVFEMPGSREIARIRLEQRGICTKVAFTPDGRHLVALCGGIKQPGELSLFETNSLKHILSYERPAYREGEKVGQPADFAESPDGKHLAVCDATGWKLWFYELVTGKYERTLPDAPAGRGADVDYAPDGKSLWIGPQFWDVETGKPVSGAYVSTEPRAISPDGKSLVSVSHEVGSARYAWIHLSDTPSQGVLNWKLSRHRFSAAAFSPDSKWLAVTGSATTADYQGGLIILWDMSKTVP